MPTLVLSARQTADGQALWRAAVRRGWSVARVRGAAVPDVDDDAIAVYLEPLMAPLVAERLGVELLDPPLDWLPRVPARWLHREVTLTTLGDAREMAAPRFVKPPNDKTFAAKVFDDGRALPREYDDATPVLVITPVRFVSEFRCFCLDGEVRASSPYLLEGELAEATGFEAPAALHEAARAFAEEVARGTADFTPRAIVIDVGLLDDGAWAVVEANGAWGAGIYGADPDAALDVIQHATVISR